MLSPLLLRTASRTSPTLWSHMRLCGLRAALSVSREADDWVLHSPRAWLGTAFHRLMSRAPTDEGSALQVWSEAIETAIKAAAGHPLDARYANPERWPGYYLVRQRAIASALAAARSRPAATQQSSPATTAPGEAEYLLTARGGRLAGRPDHFNQRAITEYKSTLPDPAWSEAADVLESFWRQLRLYAVLVAETTGAWPATARIVAASGQVLEEKVVRERCEQEADAAIGSLEVMNRALDAGRPPGDLAQPGLIACASCPYQLICPAFWKWRDQSGSPEFREPAARGNIVLIDPGQDGDLYAVTFAFTGPRSVQGAQPIAFRKSVHGDLTGCPRGTAIRMVSAQLRPDGRLRADVSTCVYSEADIPALISATVAQ